MPIQCGRDEGSVSWVSALYPEGVVGSEHTAARLVIANAAV